MIRLENITKIYNEKVDDTKALDDVSLKIEDGEFISVMGASGSGKSTLLKIIGCMDTPTAGKYFLDDTEVTAASRSQVHKLRKEKIGYVFQHFALMDYYTAYENIELPLLAANVKRKERRRIILKQMEHLGILSEKDKLPVPFPFLSNAKNPSSVPIHAVFSANPLLSRSKFTPCSSERSSMPDSPKSIMRGSRGGWALPALS